MNNDRNTYKRLDDVIYEVADHLVEAYRILNELEDLEDCDTCNKFMKKIDAVLGDLNYYMTL